MLLRFSACLLVRAPVIIPGAISTVSDDTVEWRVPHVRSRARTGDTRCLVSRAFAVPRFAGVPALRLKIFPLGSRRQSQPGHCSVYITGPKGSYLQFRLRLGVISPVTARPPPGLPTTAHHTPYMISGISLGISLGILLDLLFFDFTLNNHWVNFRVKNLNHDTGVIIMFTCYFHSNNTYIEKIWIPSL